MSRQYRILLCVAVFAFALTGASFFLSCASTRSALGIKGNVIDKPGLKEAMASIWEVSYRRSDRPPAVRIVEGAALTCVSPGGDKGFETPIGCRNGYTFTPFEVSVTYADYVEHFGWDHSTLAHEARHVVHLRNGILDGDHKLPDWRPEEDCQIPPGDCGIVARANRRLRSTAFAASYDGIMDPDFDGGVD